MFGATGFLFLLWVLSHPHTAEQRRTDHHQNDRGAQPDRADVTTVGGFGAIINTLTVPDIRAYNRFSVFLAFFSIAGLSLWLAERWRKTTGRRKVLFTAVVVSGAALSLYDQALDARWITRSYDRDKKVAAEVGTVVGSMETLFPERTAVFQFPITDFPADFNRGRMLAYDHALPYLHTDHFRWSWPPSPRAMSAGHASSRRSAAPRWFGRSRTPVSAPYGWTGLAIATAGAPLSASIVSAGGVEVLQGISRRYAVI